MYGEVVSAATRTVNEFRATVVSMIDDAVRNEVACAEYGTILPPGLIDPARRWQQHIAAAGLAGIDWAPEHHGLGLSPDHSAVWYTECALAGVAPYANFQGYILTAGALRAHGTDAQRHRHLPGILDASTIWCQLFSEPDAGSDLSSLATRAEADGDRWRITGQKIWTSTAQVSDMGILLVRTAPDTRGARGISFMLIDMHQPGVEIRPIMQMTGDAEFCEVFLDGAVVEADGLVGDLNTGWTVATSVLADERAAVGAASVRLRRRLNRIADDTTGLVARGRALETLMARTGVNPGLGPLMKLGITEFETALSRELLARHGAEAMVHTDDTEAFLYAPGMRVAGGSSEVQRDLVGERLLGLPRAPRG